MDIKKLIKGLIFNFVFLVLLLTVFFLISEFFFRTFRGKPNPLADIVQENTSSLFRPNSSRRSVSSAEGEYDYTYHINNYGYRGEDFSLSKPPGTLRIFAVGDSFTFGVGAQDHQTIPALIQKYLQAEKLNVEVINAGIGHTGPVQHYVNLRDIHLQYRPDLVLLLLDFTDLQDDWNAKRHAVLDASGEIKRFDLTYVNGKRHWWRWAMKHSSFCQWIDQKIVRSFRKLRLLGFKKYTEIAKQGIRAKAEIAADPSLDAETKIAYDGLIMLRGREQQEAIQTHWARTQQHLRKIKDLLEQRGIPLIIVMYPYGIYVGEDQWHSGRQYWGFDQNRVYTDYFAFELVEAFARHNDIAFINTLEGFLKAEKRTYFYDHDGHLNPEGNKIVAQTIVSSETFKKILKELSVKKIRL